jgi:hypothetical protein
MPKTAQVLKLFDVCKNKSLVISGEQRGVFARKQ